MSVLKYRKDIDGLRAVAVVAVIIFHAFPKFLRGGYVGVDVFFVISGFLITSIVVEAARAGQFGFFDFYVRRARRIFPALVTVLTACLLAGWFLLLPDEFKQLTSQIAGGAGFVANLVLLGEAGYFDSAAEAKPLLHLWSLGVEEQFYLTWPFLLWLSLRLKANPFWVGSGLLCASFGFNLYEAGVAPSVDFYSPLTRFWELMAGSLLGLARFYGPGRARPSGRGGFYADTLSVCGLALIFLGASSFDRTEVYPGWRAIVPVLGTALVIFGGPGGFFNRRLLGSRPLVGLGLISYPLYLWHWPLLSFAHVVSQDTKVVRFCLVGVSVALAAATYAFIEKPVRFSQGRSRRVRTAVATALLVCVGAAGLCGAGGLWAPRVAYVSKVFGIHRGDASDGYVFAGGDPLIFFKQGTTAKTTVFLGDSNALQYAPRIRRLIDDAKGPINSAMFVVSFGCPPVPKLKSELAPQCLGSADRAFALLQHHPEVDTVVVAANWMGYFWAIDHSDYYLEAGGQRSYLGPGYRGTPLALEELSAYLKDIKALGKRVFLVLNIPVAGEFAAREMIASRLTLGPWRFEDKAGNKARFMDRYGALHDGLLAAGHAADAVIIDPLDALCAGADCQALFEGEPIHSDVEHLRPDFVRDHIFYMDQTIVPH